MAIGIRRKTPQIIERGQDLVASFNENLRPGRTYQVRDNHSLSDHRHMCGDLNHRVFSPGGGEDCVRLGGILASNWQCDNQTPAGDDHYNYFDHFGDFSDDYYHYGDGLIII